jgi:hypothetical protein
MAGLSVLGFEGVLGRKGRTPLGPGRISPVGSIDKSKFALFKPLSLDVIFHDCKISDHTQGNIDAFAR